VTTFTLPLLGTLGNDKGSGSDGVLIGSMTATNPAKGLLAGHAEACVAIADDGGLFTQQTTAANQATGDDVTLLPAAPAVDDAYYLGHLTKKFGRLDINITTQGAGTWTLDWQYWDGDAWQVIPGLVDNTTAFTSTTGFKTVTFTAPADWEQNTVDSVEAYWIRANVATFDSISTQPLAGRVHIVVSNPTFTDDTTDLTSAGAGDVALLPAYPVVNDAFYYGFGERFCKIKLNYSQARTGTATIVFEYWNGAAWAALATIADDTTGYSAGAATRLVHFVPPSDWKANTAANGPNAQAGFFVRSRLSAITSVTQQPLGTQAWVLPLSTGADGLQRPVSGATLAIRRVSGSAATLSGSAADSVFLLVNVTTKAVTTFTWPKAKAVFQQDILFEMRRNAKFAVVQVIEDGSTELANGVLFLADE